MDVSRIAYIVLLAIVGLGRFVELNISRRTQQNMIARGAASVSEPHFQWMVVIHTIFLIGAVVVTLASFAGSGPTAWCKISRRTLHSKGSQCRTWFRGRWSNPKTGRSFLVSRDIATRKQMEGQLVAAREAALAASRAKSEFLSCMSHEIRAPGGRHNHE